MNIGRLVDDSPGQRSAVCPPSGDSGHSQGVEDTLSASTRSSAQLRPAHPLEVALRCRPRDWRMATVRSMKYQKGMHEVANGVWAYLQPDGGWGWSNAGLITDGNQSLLVDTLFDLKLTAEMLAAMRSTTAAAKNIGTLVNTHANGDHWFGNSLWTEPK